jgi:hypothetical protein
MSKPSEYAGTASYLRDAARKLNRAAELLEASVGYREEQALSLLKLAGEDVALSERQINRGLDRRYPVRGNAIDGDRKAVQNYWHARVIDSNEEGGCDG